MENSTNIPKCCGRKMIKSSESAHFIEVWCEQCDDLAYVKKGKIELPAMIDD